MLLRNGSCFEGFISTRNRKFFMQAEVPNYPSMRKHSLTLDWRLSLLLGDSLQPLIDKCDNFEQFLNDLTNLIEEILQPRKDLESWLVNPVKTHGLYKRLEEELRQISEYVKSVDLENGRVEIEVTDASCRIHNATVKFGDNYLKEAIKIVNYDLPIQDVSLMKKTVEFKSVTSLSGFCKQFISCIEMFQGFWNTVGLLDASCWILDPENPKFKDATRRIKVSDSLSVAITFNPYCAQQRPDIKFLGCQTHVQQFREILEKNLEAELWDPELDVLYNLTTVLETELPSKPEATETETMDLVQPGECAICFTTRLENEIPSQICDNLSCLSQYHAICLYKYLRSIPSNKDFFGRIQGECPNCDHVIMCPAPSSS